MRARSAIALSLVALLSACTGSNAPQGNPRVDDIVLTSSLQSFDACDDLLSYVTEHALEMVGPWGLNSGQFMPVDMIDTDDMADSAAAAESAGADGAADSMRAGVDYSETNVQEVGVDEPDTVKTDGERMFIVRDNALDIVDVTGDEPKLLTSVRLAGWGNTILRSEDRLLVIGESEGRPFARGSLDDWGTGTRLSLYDVGDPANPQLVSSLALDGWIVTARLIDGVARVVLRAEPTGLRFESPEGSGVRAERDATEGNKDVIRASTVDQWVPYFVHEDASGAERDGMLLDCADVHHPEAFSGLGTTSVLALDLAGDLIPDSSTGVLSGGDTVYASTERLYVATSRWHDWEVLSGRAAEEANAQYSTDVHAFDVTEADTTGYLGSGTVRGHVLNQWSMSVHEDVLRIATTEGSPWWSWQDDARLSESFVTTFAERDGGLEQLGQVGGLGLDERIYAVRYLGDVGYVVTFRETDPLYTLDLSDPANPTVLGELKIMGYSAYLHPLEDDLILGIGQDADERGTIEGLQLSLFDVSDLDNPQRIHQVTFADTYSGAEWDHHAFLHWPASGLTVVPFEKWSWDEENDTEEIDSGALAYRLDREAGFTEAGRLTHLPDGLDQRDARYWDVAWRAGIQRSVVIGDALYTISHLGVKVSDLDTLDDRAWLGLPHRSG
jgi:uncharacterized secreted protein with C-terminal beta-propeller domain